MRHAGELGAPSRLAPAARAVPRRCRPQDSPARATPTPHARPVCKHPLNDCSLLLPTILSVNLCASLNQRNSNFIKNKKDISPMLNIQCY